MSGRNIVYVWTNNGGMGDAILAGSSHSFGVLPLRFGASFTLDFLLPGYHHRCSGSFECQWERNPTLSSFGSAPALTSSTYFLL